MWFSLFSILFALNLHAGPSSPNAVDFGVGGLNEVLPPLIDRSFNTVSDMNEALALVRERCKERMAHLVPIPRLVSVDYLLRNPLFRQARGFATVPVKLANGTETQLTGGSNGFIYTVTSLEDDGPGTLRCAVEPRPQVLADPKAFPKWMRVCAEMAKLPLHVTFHTVGILNLDSPVKIASEKTIDGRGTAIQIRGGPLQIENAQNVVLTNLIFDQSDSFSAENAIVISGSSRHVWIHKSDFLDHKGPQVLLQNLNTGNPKHEPTTVTISNSRFIGGNEGVAIGSSASKEPADRNIHLTLWQNQFEETKYRSVSISTGKAHLFRNLFRKIEGTAVSVHNDGEALAEFNGFIIGQEAKTFDRSPAGVKEVGHVELRENRRKVGSEFPIVSLDRGADRQVFTPGRYYLYTNPTEDQKIGFHHEANPLIRLKTGTPVQDRFNRFQI